MTVYEKATGKHFDPNTIRDQQQVRLNLKLLTIEELRFLQRIIEKGAIELPAEQLTEAEQAVIEGKAAEEPEEPQSQGRSTNHLMAVRYWLVRSC